MHDNGSSPAARPTFERALRGYSTDAVDAWVAAASREIASLRAALEAANARTAELEGSRTVLVRTITSAQLMAERLVEETNEEAVRRREQAAADAALVMTTARRDADALVADARLRARRELAALDVERTEIQAEVAQLRALLRSERLRARDGLTSALAAIDRSLGTDVYEPTVRDARAKAALPTTLTVVAS